MNNRVIIIFILFVVTFSSCNNYQEPKGEFERFIHIIQDCNNLGNPDINCIEYLVFDEQNMASIYLQNKKQLERYSYINQNDTLIFTYLLDKDEQLKFIYLSNDTLQRISNRTFWIKTIWAR